jgi:mono/diheme cytochrome c family protein
MRDARSLFIAYVPPGSLEPGRQLATTGGNAKSAPCTICHGPELNGVGPIPGPRRTVAESPRATTLRFSTTQAGRSIEPTHGAQCHQAEARRHGGVRRLRGGPSALNSHAQTRRRNTS